MKAQRVLKRVYDWGRLRMAWKQIEKNAEAAGIYRFQPARRVLIEKEGSQKKRKLGIPTVMDRIVSQGVHLVLHGIFDSGFTTSNFGFR